MELNHRRLVTRDQSIRVLLRRCRPGKDLMVIPNLVPRGCIPFGQHQGCKTSGIINVKMLANRNLIGYYFLPEVYEKGVSKQEIKVLRMLLLDVFDHVRDGQWERNLKMGDAN